jgi:hypothetical protein
MMIVITFVVLLLNALLMAYVLDAASRTVHLLGADTARRGGPRDVWLLRGAAGASRPAP